MLTSLMRYLGILVVFASLAVALPNSALAQARPGQPVPATHTEVTGKVSIQVQVVHANNSGVVDPDLEAVAANFKAFKYTGFQKLEAFDAKLAPNQEAQFNMVGGHKVKVMLVSRDSRQAKVRVMMFNDSGKVMDTTVAINRNRAFMIAGTSYKDGKLILPIHVRY
ncbi:MAG: hypothetical protein H6737_13210 [Alphaproteobacteria bacterium]|nr:hypothetical protein [Alphaproteobacteria bacterium]